jgi:hypothetical protein
MRVVHAVSLAVVSAGAGCWSDAADDSIATVESATTINNGLNLNGLNLNGLNLNGTSELGSVIAWVSYRDAELAGAQLGNVHLDGSQIVARRAHATVSGTGVVGATFVGSSDIGMDLSLRVAAAFAPAGNQDPTTWRYLVEYQEVDGTWWPICVNGTTPVPAIPVDGYWDLRTGNPGDGSKHTNKQRFLFACEQVGAIGKCIEAGYRPWQKVSGRSLDRYHQSCVRLLRADFCGTSVPHTVEGSVLNVYDNLGIQVDTENWFPEAEWDRSGARCISPLATTADIANVPCLDELLDDDCALGFTPHTLLITERP